LSRLWGLFLLLNGGCALRVAGQTLTDFVPAAFPAAGVSGMLGMLGLSLWAIHLWRIMSGRFAPALELAQPAGAEGALTTSDRVGNILECYPFLLNTFLAYGFRPAGDRPAGSCSSARCRGGG
jgi:hypothetical protein